MSIPDAEALDMFNGEMEAIRREFGLDDPEYRRQHDALLAECLAIDPDYNPYGADTEELKRDLEKLRRGIPFAVFSGWS